MLYEARQWDDATNATSIMQDVQGAFNYLRTKSPNLSYLSTTPASLADPAWSDDAW